MTTGTVMALCGLLVNMLFVGSQLFSGERTDKKRFAEQKEPATIDGNTGIMI